MLRSFGRRAPAAIAASAAAAYTWRPTNCESSASDQLSLLWKPPPFSLETSRFDMASYVGRALHFIDVLGDLSMLTISAEQIAASRKLLDAQHGASDSELWRAKKIQAACVHPETGEVIAAPFRFSAFAPANLIICGGLLWASSTSLKASAFWQWINQSYNVGVNHANRSSDSPPPERLAAAYCGATGSSVAIALALQHLGSKLQGRARLVQLTVPMIGVSVGAVVNLVMTRSEELKRGIPVADTQGNDLGRSQLAARTALAQCSATRVAWTVALLTLAPIASGAALRLLPALPRAVAAAVDATANFGVIWLSVPLCIAIFPQHTSLPTIAVEERFARGGHERVFFNKGL